MSWYCDIAPGHPQHGPYHEFEYGFPLTEDAALFERLCLEIFQAGLSWLIILKKREAIYQAFDAFDLAKVAAYGEADVERLLGNPGIIRNRRKIMAIIENAKRVQQLCVRHGTFALWLAAQPEQSKEAWVRLFKQTFTFTGGEVVNEFLMSIGLLPGAHRPDCPVQLRLNALKK
jgi:DNA-3-methyladenine glycosylase I